MAKEKATDRVRVYPIDAHKLRVLAKKRGGKVIPADIVNELLKQFRGALKVASNLEK